MLQRTRRSPMCSIASRQRGRKPCSTLRSALCTSTCARSSPARRASPAGDRRINFAAEVLAARQGAPKLRRDGEEFHQDVAVLRLAGEQREMGERRQLQRLAFGEQAGSETIVVVIRERSVDRMLGKIRLHDDLARRGATPGASGDLLQQCEEPLRGAEIRAVQERCPPPARRPGSGAENRDPWPASACRPGCRLHRRRWCRASRRSCPCVACCRDRCAGCAPTGNAMRGPARGAGFRNPGAADPCCRSSDRHEEAGRLRRNDGSATDRRRGAPPGVRRNSGTSPSSRRRRTARMARSRGG